QNTGAEDVLGVPMEMNGRRLGALIVTSGTATDWTDGDVAAVGRTAATSAPLIALWRQAEEARRRREEAAALADLIREAAVQPEQERMLDSIVRRFSTLLGATESSGIVLRRGGALGPRAVWGGETAPRLAPTTGYAGSLTERVLRENRTLVASENPNPTQGEVDVSSYEFFRQRGVKTVLITPLRGFGEDEGTLYAAWLERVVIAPWHVRLAETLAHHAGAVLEHARMQATLADLAGRFLRSQGEARPVVTRRERQLLVLTAQGRSGPEIAEQLGLTKLTVEQYMKRLMVKLGAPSRAAAVARALAWNLIGPEEVDRAGDG
ncbi:MAG TPA: LuxR C-terminal-related transcriptional regulator, partial [Nonomuraea sp.]|nr:LuxR C-terminal-related transcriptional regulator [Nonomuraea sp.]